MCTSHVGAGPACTTFATVVRERAASAADTEKAMLPTDLRLYMYYERIKVHGVERHLQAK